MELRWLTRVVVYGDILAGENNKYTTVLQYRVYGDMWSDWMDVPTVKE